MPGKVERQQVEMICRLLGTPTERAWKRFPALEHNVDFPVHQQSYACLGWRFSLSWRRRFVVLVWMIADRLLCVRLCSYSTLRAKFPQLSAHAFDLMSQFLTYDPDKRITAAEGARAVTCCGLRVGADLCAALKHPYFLESPLPTPIDLMPSFPSLHDRDTYVLALLSSQTVSLFVHVRQWVDRVRAWMSECS